MTKMRLSTKIKLLFLLVVLGAMVISNYYIFGLTKNNIEGHVIDSLDLLADLIENDLDAFKTQIKNRVIDFSSDGFIRDSLVSLNKKPDLKITELLNEHLIKNKMSLDPTIYGINIIDLDGTVVASTDKKEIGFNEFEHEYFKAGMGLNYGEGYFSDVAFSHHFGHTNPEITAIAPLFDISSGKKIGIIINYIDAKMLSDSIKIRERTKSTKMTFYAPIESKSTFETVLVNKDKLLLSEVKFLKGDVILKQKVDTLPIKSCEEGEFIGTVFKDYRGAMVLGASRCLEKGWTLVVKVNEVEALEDITNIRNYAIAAIILFSIFLYFLIYFFVGRLTKSLTYLTSVVDKISRGDLSQRANIKTQDEVGDLARAFNAMTETLMRAPKKLAMTVKEKTGELHAKILELEDSRRAILNVVEDLDQEKEKLQKEKIKDEAILLGIGDGVFVLDKNLRINIFNKTASAISGYSAKEAIGKKYDEVLKFTSEADGLPNNKFIENVFKTGQVQKMVDHMVLKRKDGTTVAVADSAAPLLGSNGKIDGCVVVFRDVAKERELDRAKTEFVSLASHQLRTPLTSIKWYGEMLMQEDLKEKNRQSYIKQIYDSNERMIELVNALLNVSRVEMGTLTIEPQPTNLIEVAQVVIEELSSQIKQKKIQLKKIFGANLPKINIDQKLIKIVFQNLLSNAVKYTPEKGKIMFEIKKQDEKIFFRVQDNGIGIPNNQQAKIFSKFFRVDNAREMDPDGTGLGLYIVKSFLEKIGGRIWFESALKKGSVFYVTLPIKNIMKNNVKNNKLL